MTDFTLEQLDAIVTARAQSEDEKSYTRKLVNKGVAKCAQKLGEEAVEAAIAAVQEDREELTAEAADVLYHLLVVLNVSNVPLQNVMKELGRRTGQTGLEEKASRPQD